MMAMQPFTHIRLADNRGITILEVLIAAFITAIMVTATFRFYSAMQLQSEAQYEVSETHHICRASLHDIKKTLRVAGYKLSGHPPYEINGDSLAVYFSLTQPVDTVLYFLVEYSDQEYAMVPNLPTGRRLFNLMKQTNSSPPGLFANLITGIRYAPVDSANMVVSISSQTSKQDNAYSPSNGYRSYSMVERVSIRNVS